ncbi:MAG: glycosyltransferase family 9 protein [Achromobacter sp.]|uniref:glycosyltransferase family 9 protein n=1 Tax=Achromobacter sp. TaxID=134375 RepID=UPI003CFD009F
MSDIVVYVRSQPQLGDQIVAFATLYQLKAWWPERRLKVVARDDVGHIYRGLPWVDEFLRARSLLDYARSLTGRTQVSVNLHHSSERFGLINLLRPPAIRMGFRNARISDLVWTHCHRKDESEYIGLANLRLLATYRPLDAEHVARRCFAELARPHRHNPRGSDVVFLPGGGSGPFKRWSLAHYLRLADSLKTLLGADTRYTFVLGRQEARERAELDALRRGDIDVAYCRPLSELSALMLRARLVVANDCGPSHVAQAVGVPYVGVFNQPNPEWFWRRRGAVEVVPREPRAGINAIRPEQVLHACTRALSRTRPMPA